MFRETDNAGLLVNDPVILANQHTFTASQQPHDIEHPVASFADTAATAVSSVSVETGGGGVSGGEGMVAAMGGAGIPGISITSMRLASCQTDGIAGQYTTQYIVLMTVDIPWLW